MHASKELIKPAIVLKHHDSLGELEELCLFILAMNGDGFNLDYVRKKLFVFCGRDVSNSTIYKVFIRSISKELVESRFGEKELKKGGKRKIIFRLTNTGYQLIRERHQMKVELWSNLDTNVFRG